MAKKKENPEVKTPDEVMKAAGIQAPEPESEPTISPELEASKPSDPGGKPVWNLRKMAGTNKHYVSAAGSYTFECHGYSEGRQLMQCLMRCTSEEVNKASIDKPLQV